MCSLPANRQDGLFGLSRQDGDAPLWALSAQVRAYAAAGEMLSVNTVFSQDTSTFNAMCIDTKRNGFIQVRSMRLSLFFGVDAREFAQAVRF